MSETIPTDWKEKVCRILALYPDDTIKVTLTARTSWETLFLDLFICDLCIVIAEYLESGDIVGEPKDMDEPGMTYAMIYEHQGVKIHSKVGLIADETVVKIYSAHIPRKGENP